MIATLMGYLASLLLAISLIVTNELRFRWINAFGCVAFIIYGLLIGAMPVLLTNAILLLINIYRLYRSYQATEAFDIYEFSADDHIIHKFLSFYAKDIEAYYPGFKLQPQPNQVRFVVLRDMNIANVFVANLLPDGTADVQINYTIPKYRDFKVGTFIFQRNKQFLLERNVRTVSYHSVRNAGHLAFLKRMGFEPAGSGMAKAI